MKQLVINKEDLRHNISRVKTFANGVNIIGIVKGNGYGLGLLEYSKFLIDNGLEYSAVATTEEAIELSKASVTKNILLLSVINNKEELEKVIKNEITITVGSLENAKQVGNENKTK